MNENKRYQKALNSIPAHYDVDLEKVRNAHKPAGMKAGRLLMAAIAMVFAVFSTVYAVNADFRQSFNMWISGRKTDAVITQISDGLYGIEITMPDGNVINTTAETEESAEEVISHYKNLVVCEKNREGRVMIYYQNRYEDITDRFKKLDAAAEYQDENGQTVCDLIADYCYIEYGGKYNCIVHIVNEDAGIDRYTVMANDTGFVQGGYGGQLLPAYEEYMGSAKYYETAEVRPIGDTTILFYHDKSIDLSDQWIEWNYEFDLKSEDQNTGEPFSEHIVYDGYCYLKVDDMYFSIAKEYGYFEDPDNITTGCSVTGCEEGFIVLQLADGTYIPEPAEGPIAQPETAE